MPTDKALTVQRTTAGWRLHGAGCEPANAFLERIELRGLAEGSMRTYAFDLLNLTRWLNHQGLAPAAVTREDFFAFLKDHRGRLKAVTLNRQLRLLQRWATSERPPIAGGVRRRRARARAQDPLPSVREAQVIRRPLTDQQTRRMLEGFRTHRDRAMAGLMWALGLRVGEVLALTLPDLDWEHATILVHGKGRRERSLPLLAQVSGLIRRYLEWERPKNADERLFVVLKGPRRGRPLTYAGARRLFRYYRGQLQIPEAHPHRFRHTFAANMVRQGLSLPMLMRLMGHTWISTTVRYVHFDDRELREHYEKALARLNAADPAGGQRPAVL